jgi:hypothetical protein
MLKQWEKAGFWGMLTVIMVCFLVLLGDAGAAVTHYVTVTQGLDGTISPTKASGQVPVIEGYNKKFTITPNLNYHVSDILVDGVSVIDGLTPVNKVYYYKFANVTADHEITATFSKDTHALTVSKLGTGAGTLTAMNIDCGSDCSENYDHGTEVVLTATPDAGSIFKGWIIEGVQVSSAPTYAVKMKGGKNIGAKFSKTYNVSISKAGAGTGTVTASGISCGSDCDSTYVAGKTIAFTAKPTSDSKFAGWTGDYSGQAKTI